jgi:NADH dehydrogenase
VSALLGTLFVTVIALSLQTMPDKTIFLTGGSGFVGRAVIDALVRGDYRVRALVHDRPIEHAGVESVQGDLFDNVALDAGITGCEAAIHLVGIIREDPGKGITFARIHDEGARRVIDAAKRNNVGRFLHMSALGARADSASDYARTKAAAEAYLRASGLAYTIFRPSVIVGPGGEFARMLEGWSRGTQMPYHFMPYFGTGLFGLSPKKVQPVDVRDVAAAFVKSLSMSETIGQTYDLGGPEPMSWPRMYALASEHYVGEPKIQLGFPIWYATLLTRLAPAKWLPFNRSQLVMAGEDNVCDPSVLERVFGVKPHGLVEALSG